MKKSILLLLFVFLFIPSVNAGYDVTNPNCTDDVKLALRGAALKVSFITNKYTDNSTVYYSIDIASLPNDINVQDNDTKLIYNNQNLKILKITPGTTKSLLLIANSNSVCNGYSIYTNLVPIPYYNKYKDDPLCVGNEEYFLCQEDTSLQVSYDEFKTLINEYIKEKNTKPTGNNTVTPTPEKTSVVDEIMNFIANYYIYMLITIIVLGTTGIVIIEVRRRKSIL